MAFYGTASGQSVYNATDDVHYATVADALNAPATGAGDEIQLGSGTHEGGILVSKSGLVIKAAPGAPTRPLIQISGPTGVLGTVQLAPGVNDVTIEGLEIIGLDGPAGLEKAAVYFQGAHDGITLRGNTITAKGDSAILTEYGQANSDITIEDNLINGHTFDTAQVTGVGDQWVVPNVPRVLVYMSSGSPFSHTNIVFRGNTVSGISGDATNGNVGINLDGAGVTVEDNVFSGATGDKPGVAMLRVRGSSTTVTGNTFGGDASVALAVGTGSIDTAATSSATGNVFSGTFDTKVANASASALDATLNFWGDASRPESPADFAGTVTSLPYFKDAGLATAGPIRIVENGPATGYPTILAALTAATGGQTIELDAGLYTEAPVDVNKAVTLRGPNAGVAGAAARAAEARISNTPLTITAAATVDGVEVHQTNNASNAVLVQAAATVSNSVIRREGATTGDFSRGVTTAVGVAGVSITGNLFTGDLSGGLFGGHRTWQSAIYANGGSATITGNTFRHSRSAINADDFNAGIAITANAFSTCGTYLSFGGTTPTTGQFTIAGNDFGFDFNLAPAANPSLFNNSNVAATFRVNATGNTFGGVATGDLTDSQKFLLEARMFHRDRPGKKGVIDFVAGQQVVAAGAASIASAIGAAAAGDTVLVGPGSFAEDVVVNKPLRLLGAGPAVTTLVGTKGDATRDTLNVSANDVEVAGFEITRAGNTVADWNDANGALNNQGVNISNCGGTLLHDNLITGNRNGIYLSNTNGARIRNNVITNNRTGMHLVKQAAGPTVEENEITDNWTMGVLFREELPNVGETPGAEFRNNNISGNWYSQVDDRATSTAPRNLEYNWLGSASPGVTSAASGEPGYAGQIPVEFGGTAVAPAVAPEIAGAASANIDFTPMLAEGTDTDVETAPGRGTYGFQGDLGEVVEALLGDVVIDDYRTFGHLYVPAGSKVTVAPAGTLVADKLDLAPGATLFVNGGELVIGDGSRVAGTFTIFNSFGSWDIHGDTTFEIGRSLALVTDIHVAAGVTLTVNGGGELVLDGCVIDSQTPGSPYSIMVEDDGLLTIARSVVTDARIDIDTLASSVPAHHRSKIYDSRFASSDIEASAAAGVYHNLFDAATDTASDTDASGAFGAVDGWSNVTDAGLLQNPFALEFGVPALPDRTLEDGNLFVQSGDAVAVDLKVGNLAPHTVTLAEALLGYNSERLILAGSAPAVTPAAGWDVVIDDDSVTAPLGLVDSTLALDLAAGDDGISGPATIGTVHFSAGTAGAAVGFFRVQTDGAYNPDGSFVRDTRLTKSTAGIPSFLTAFTANTGELVVDNDAPSVAVPAVSGLQVQPSVGSINILPPTANFVIRDQDPVILTFTATDAGLAGLDADDAENDLVLTADNGLGTVLDGDDYTVTAVEALGVVTYTVTLDIPASAGNGTYAIAAVVQDRSGNDSAPASLGLFVIANEVLATVELQGFVGTGPGSLRDVTFAATGGASTKTWTKSVSFTSSLGTVVLEDVPAGTTAISAKSAWTLRSKKAVALSPAGAGSIALTGADKLNAGDFNGDNVVNTLDYSILRYHWLSALPAAAVADASGDGSVTSADYNLLVPNFYTVGDAQ